MIILGKQIIRPWSPNHQLNLTVKDLLSRTKRSICYLPIILTTEDELLVPATLSTTQVYLALLSAPLITKELSSLRETFSPPITRIPSFFQVTDGFGTPLTGHLMVMVVFEAAVTLSPMFIVTGLPSPTGISFPGSETWISGLAGSVVT